MVRVTKWFCNRCGTEIIPEDWYELCSICSEAYQVLEQEIRLLKKEFYK